MVPVGVHMYIASTKLQSFRGETVERDPWHAGLSLQAYHSDLCFVCLGHAEFGNPGVTSGSGSSSGLTQAQFKFLHSTSRNGPRLSDGAVSTESIGRWHYCNTRAVVCSESKWQSSQFVLPVGVAVLINHGFCRNVDDDC